GLSLAPGTAFTFTVAGTAGTVASFLTVGNTAWVSASSACAAVESVSNGVWFPIGPVPALGIAVVKTQTPAAPAPGAPITYRIDITNTGGTTILNIALVDTLSPVLKG